MAANPSSALQEPGHAPAPPVAGRHGAPGDRGLTPMLSLFPSPGHPTVQAASPGSAAAPAPLPGTELRRLCPESAGGAPFTAQTVTAYQMSPRETYDWIRGNDTSRQVTATIAEGLKRRPPAKPSPCCSRMVAPPIPTARIPADFGQRDRALAPHAAALGPAQPVAGARQPSPRASRCRCRPDGHRGRHRTMPSRDSRRGSIS